MNLIILDNEKLNNKHSNNYQKQNQQNLEQIYDPPSRKNIIKQFVNSKKLTQIKHIQQFNDSLDIRGKNSMIKNDQLKFQDPLMNSQKLNKLNPNKIKSLILEKNKSLSFFQPSTQRNEDVDSLRQSKMMYPHSYRDSQHSLILKYSIEARKILIDKPIEKTNEERNQLNKFDIRSPLLRNSLFTININDSIIQNTSKYCKAKLYGVRGNGGTGCLFKLPLENLDFTNKIYSSTSKHESMQKNVMNKKQQEELMKNLSIKNISLNAMPVIPLKDNRNALINLNYTQLFVLSEGGEGQIYYLSQLQFSHQIPLKQGYFQVLYREHFLQLCQGILYAQVSQLQDENFIEQNQVFLGPNTSRSQKTIIFDLDETLVHCNESLILPSDVQIEIKVNQSELIKAGVNIRPYAFYLIKELAKDFELIIFTSSHHSYANEVINYLDPDGFYISHRFFRDKCQVTTQNVYIKDLRIFADRNLKDVVLIDNASYSFGGLISNGIPIIPFYFRKDDIELKYLMPYLKELLNQKDVRTYNEKNLKLHYCLDNQVPQKVYEQLFNKK